nr:restriction endonuclease [uncultured Rhodoferax sp.]
MTNYDFSSLNDKDFEVLVADLLSIEHKARFERFKAGRDGGIDGRYFAPTGGQVIFQCKHWAKTGYAALLRSLKNTEYAKVVKLNPTRYILATTVPLSAADKAEIRSVFGKFMHNDADVLGCEDVNDLLRKHPQVEKSHFKLWLHSAEVLATLANAAILGRSAFTLQEIRERSSAYVQTASHVLAREKVKKMGVLLITGEPGIGKTTLAEQLCLEYVVDGYQLCVAANQIEELESLYQGEAKQVFYFDDFLGSNFLSALNRHEDTHIVSFIRRVTKDKNKKFILTSRSTVLNRGKTLTDRFRIEKLDQHEFEIEVKSLSELDKARILHSRLWFSGIPREYLEIIVGQRKYWTIIRHPNFNPRLIAFITDPSRFSGVLPADYWGYVEGTLQNPIDVWDHVFNSQLTDWTRLTVLLTVFAGGSIDERRLRSCYESLSSNTLVQNYVGDADFDMGMRVLVGSVLNRRVDGSDITVSLFNPSIADYVLRKTSNSVSKLGGLLTALFDIRSMDNFDMLRANGIVTLEVYVDVLRQLCRTKLSTGSLHPDSVVCEARLCELTVQHCDVGNHPMPEIHRFVLAVSELPACCQYLSAISPLLVYELQSQLISEEAIAKLLNGFDAVDMDSEELESVSKLLPLLPENFRAALDGSLRSAIVDFWQNFLEREIVERDVLSDFFDYEDSDQAERLIEEELGRILEDYGITFTQSECDEIMKYVDVGDIINGNIKRASHYDDDGDRSYVDRGPSEIDDLFSFDVP